MNKDNEMISVVVPVYNTEAYLDRCINSLIKQTVKNIEIILIDDGSTDKSGEICDHYAGINKNVKVIHQENRGQASARNEGLKIAKGDYIGFVDSDDWVSYDMYENMLETMKEENCDVVECDYIRSSEFINIESNCKKAEKRIFDTENILKEHLLGKCFESVIWNKLFKKNIVNHLFIEGRYLEDIFWLYPVLANCKKGAHLYKELYVYFQRGDSLSGETYSIKKLESIECAVERAEFINEKFPELLPFAEANKIGLGLYHYQQLLLNHKLDEEGNYRRKICDMVKNNKSKWRHILSLKQKLWLTMFLKFPEITARIRNVLRIGI